MIRVKDSLQKAAASNTYLNDFLYQRLTTRETAEMATLIEKLSSQDSLTEPFELLRLKKAIMNGEVCYSRNRNYSNSIIYGIWNALFPFADPLNCCQTPSVEHGLIIAKDIYYDVSYTARQAVVTMGPFRKRVIRKKLYIPVFCCGPYIQYASHYYSWRQIQNYRESHGRTLLVFPQHSTDACSVERELSQYVREILLRAEGFDTVIACVFWWNLDDPLVDCLKAEGVEIMCAGFRDDPLFLSRLKTIIALSDEVLSDGIGTHVGYCIAEGKLVSLLDHESSHRVFTEWERRNGSFVSTKESEIKNALAQGGDSLQATLGDLWGLGKSLSAVDRRTIVDITKDITTESYGWACMRRKSIHKVLAGYMTNGMHRHYELLKEAMEIDDEY